MAVQAHVPVAPPRVGSERARAPAPTHSAEALLSLFRGVIPSLSGASEKGEHGAIAVLCARSNSASSAYFASMAALRTGADLVTVYCDSATRAAIQALCAEVVAPVVGLGVSDVEILEADAVIVIAGNEENESVERVLSLAIDGVMPVVLDASSSWLEARWGGMCDKAHAARRRGGLVLATLNHVELASLGEAVSSVGVVNVVRSDECIALLAKGAVDVVVCGGGSVRTHVTTQGSRKRAAGMGDVLAGVAATFLYWSIRAIKESRVIGTSPEFHAAAAVAASAVARRAAALAFVKRGRSLVASDILAELALAGVELECGALRTT